jgi:hypothetical protein
MEMSRLHAFAIKNPGTYWLGPRASLDILEKRKTGSIVRCPEIKNGRQR